MTDTRRPTPPAGGNGPEEAQLGSSRETDNTSSAGASQAVIVGSFAKNKAETVFVRIDSYKGVAYVDLRIFAAYDGAGEPRPTKKGLAVKPALLPELIRLLQLAETEARTRGLL